jgi:DNA helicase-2/ATP-dependent DNA helicase PcrA
MLDLSGLNPEQLQAVQHGRGPLLVLAGAGSGKTRVITFRTARLMERGVAPENILVVTFTNKAAAEMRQRILTMVPGERGKALTLSTFHAFGARLLRTYASHLGYRQNFSILDGSDQLRLVKGTMNDLRLTRSGVSPEQVLRWVGRAKQKRTTPAGLPEARFSPFLPHAQRVYDAYGAALRAMNAVDFDDLLLLPLQLLEEHADVRERVVDTYRYVMVDEYQDTNDVQLRLLAALASHGNLMVVGDDDQSIYGFRGAAAGNILGFHESFPGAGIIKLEQNYRSTSHILDAANAVIANNSERHDKRLWSARGAGHVARLVSCSDERDEAAFVADEIATRHEYGVPYESVAILYRVNPQSKLFEEALRARRIPYRIVGSTALFDRAEVRDWVAYLTLVVNPYNDVQLRRVINVPRRGLGPAAVAVIDERARELGGALWRALRDEETLQQLPSGGREGALQLQNLVHDGQRSLLDRRGAALAQAAAAFFERTGLPRYLRETEKGAGGEVRVESIRQLISGMAEADDLPTYLSGLALDGRSSESSKDAAGVTLLTLHSSKGLEFPEVYLVGFEQDLLPHKNSLETPGAIAEERRLCYVGMTRAMERLTLTAARTRTHRQERLPRKPSIFLAEIPEELLDRSSERGAPPGEAPATAPEADPAMAKNLSYLAQIRALLGGGG